MRGKRTAAVVAAITLTAWIVKDVLASFALTTAAGAVLGAPVSAGRVRWNPLAQTLRLEELRVRQPRGFGRGFLAEVSSARVRYDGFSFLTGRPHLPEVAVDVKQVVIVRSSDKRLNVDALKIASAGRRETAAPGPKPAVKIDELRLSMNRVVYKDTSRAGKPRVDVHDLALRDAVYRDLPGPSQVAGVILGQSLRAAAIQGALLYGTAALAGVSLLPVGAVFVLAGRDSVETDLRAGSRRVFASAKSAIETLGEIQEADPRQGVLSGQIDGSGVRVEIGRASGKTSVRVSARKLLIPQPGVAAAVSYLIEEGLS